MPAVSSTIASHTEQFGILPASKATSTKVAKEATPTKAITPKRSSTAATARSGNAPHIPAPPRSADVRGSATTDGANALPRLAIPARPGSSQTQLVMHLIRGASATSSAATARAFRTPMTGNIGAHMQSSSPRDDAGLIADTLLSLRTVSSERLSSWPLSSVSAPPNALRTPRTMASAPTDATGSATKISGDLAPPTPSRKRNRLKPFKGPLHQSLSKELAAIRLAHHRVLRNITESEPPPSSAAHAHQHIKRDAITTDLDVLQKCSDFLRSLRLGTLARRPDTTASSVERSLHMEDDGGDRDDDRRSVHSAATSALSPAMQGLLDVVRQSCAAEALELFLSATLPTTTRQEWEHFELTILPAKIRDDVTAPLIETHDQLAAVDAATYARLDVELAHVANTESDWASQREVHKAEIDAMLAAAENNTDTLGALDRRFQVLFDRHAVEHAQSQEAKQRIELVDQLRRNEKTLKTEILQMHTHLGNVQRRKDALVAEKSSELKKVIDLEEDVKEETRGLLSEKQWLSERHASISMRYAEELSRTSTIEAEIAELKVRMKRSTHDIPIGQHLTPRPHWTERLELVTAYRLPPPKLTLDAAVADENDSSTSFIDADEDAMRRSQRGSRRDMTIGGAGTSMRKPALGLSTANSFAMTSGVGGRKRTVGGMSMFGGSIMRGASFLMARGGSSSAGAADQQALSTCSSFREMMLRIRERLSVQSELLRVAQEHIKDFKDHHNQQLDLVANVCALNVASAGSCIAKHAATAVPPMGSAGAQLPIPSWSTHELSQRSLALWSAVLDGLVAKGDLSMTHLEQATPQALLRLVQRRSMACVQSAASAQRAALIGLHSRGMMASGSPQRRSHGASAAAPEPAPFPATSSSGSIALAASSSAATPLMSSARGSGSAAPRTAQQQQHGSVSAPTTPSGHGHPTNAHSAVTFGQAAAEEMQFAQLWYMLTKQLDAYAANAATWGPSLLDSSLMGGGAFGSSAHLGSGGGGMSPRRGSVAAFAASGKGGAKKALGGGGGASRPFGDALRAIHELGTDPDTNAPLDRVTVVAAMCLIAFSLPPRILEDVGLFLEAMEAAAVEISTSEEFAAGVAAHHIGQWIGARHFAQRVRELCGTFGFGAIAASDLEAQIMRVAVGSTVPIGLGGVLSQGGVLGATSSTGLMPAGNGAAQHASPSPSSTMMPQHNDSFASPNKYNASSPAGGSHMSSSSPTKDASGAGGGAPSGSGCYLLRDVRLPASMSRAQQQQLGWASKVALGEAAASSTPYARPRQQGSSAAGGAASSMSGGAMSSSVGNTSALSATSIHHTSSVSGNPRGSRVSPLSATALQEDPTFETGAANTSFVPYRTVFAVAPRWKGLLDCVVKHHQLQQHQLLYWLTKVLVENCFPSEAVPGVFVIPGRVLEVKLPQQYWNVDDPMFPDIGAMMEYYHRYPMPMVKDERRRSTAAAVPIAAQAGAQRSKAADGGIWKLHVTRLMETIIQACDAAASAEHFPAPSPTNRFGAGGAGGGNKKKFTTEDPMEWSISSESSPVGVKQGKGFVTGSPLSSPRRTSPRSNGTTTGSANRKSSSEAGGVKRAEARGSKGTSSIVSLHTQETAGPLTPLGVYLRFVHRQSTSAAKRVAPTTTTVAGSAADEPSYVWRPPSQKPAKLDDFYDVEEVFQHLSTIPLKRFMYQ